MPLPGLKTTLPVMNVPSHTRLCAGPNKRSHFFRQHRYDKIRQNQFHIKKTFICAGSADAMACETINRVPLRRKHDIVCAVKRQSATPPNMK